MTRKPDSLPTDLSTAHAIIIAQRDALLTAEARATAAESEAKFRALLIEKLKYTIARLRHEQYGQSSERSTVLDQLELQLSELQEDPLKLTLRRSWQQRGRKPRVQPPRTHSCASSIVASRRAVRCPSNCRANASSIRRLRHAHAAVGLCTSWARM